MLDRVLLSLLLLAPAAAGPVRAASVAAPVQAAPARSLPNFNLSPAAVNQGFTAARDRLGASLDAVAAIPASERTFANTVKAMEDAHAEYDAAVTPMEILADVSADAKVRKAAEELKKASAALLIDLGMREDLYRAAKEAAAKGEPLAGEDKLLLEETLKSYRDNGLELSGERRERFKAIQKRLSELEEAFGSNLTKGKRGFDVPRDQLDGLPEKFVAGLKPVGEDRVRITLDYPTIEPFLENSRNPALRQKAEFKFNTQAKKNLRVLDEALKLRHELAGLLGHPSYAHYALEDRMAKEPGRVTAFLDRLKTLLAPAGAADKKDLLELKRQDQPGADRLYHWDITGEIGSQIGFYLNEMMKRRYAFDPEEVRQYFPVDRVVAETLRLYEDLMGLKFREIPASEIAAGEVWHPEVRLFELADAATGKRIGHFYLDLYPREGKYGHMAAFELLNGRETSGGYSEPAAAMVGNFSRGSGGEPALLSHGEVETFFHEFGHIIHQTLSRARYPSFNGFYTAVDFVEAPSQMLENFVWAPEVLERLSGHYQDESKKLPPELLAKMLAAKRAGKALQVLRLAALSAVDMAYHAAVPADTTEVLNRIFTEFGYLPPTPGTHFQSRWGHILSEYGAGYYGYLWSQVFASDIFSRFEKEGVLNPKVGMDYRRKVLEPGASKDENELLRDFLGREANDEAFLRSLGLGSSS